MDRQRFAAPGPVPSVTVLNRCPGELAILGRVGSDVCAGDHLPGQLLGFIGAQLGRGAEGDHPQPSLHDGLDDIGLLPARVGPQTKARELSGPDDAPCPAPSGGGSANVIVLVDL